MQGETHSFVIRIWYEVVDKEEKPSVWRGCIEHVGFNQRLYFYNMNQLTRFIKEQAGLRRNTPRFDWQSIVARFRRSKNS